MDSYLNTKLKGMKGRKEQMKTGNKKKVKEEDRESLRVRKKRKKKLKIYIKRQ